MTQRLREGDVISIPLDGGHALGVLARLSKGGRMCLGYLFLSPGPLQADRADLCALFGGHDLLTGAWKVLGPLPDWNRNDWPLPAFRNQDVVSGAWRLTRYDEDLDIVGMGPTTPEVAQRHPEDGSFGPDALIAVLSRLAASKGVKPLQELPHLGPAVPTTLRRKRPAAAKTGRA